jgi:proteasome lid subunit RPN8/RPN11
MKLVLPASLQVQIAREAMTAYPRECCGLIEGVEESVEEGGGFRAVLLHPGRNLAVAADRFELDPADHIAALKAARSRGHVLIGCYHSHPDGAAKPSRADRAGAAQEDFVWLIAATDGVHCRLAGFVYRAPDFEELILALGADCVTSSLNDRK